ncbi:MAG TPA: AAA family ATPase [Ktedonobacteraceae bacterium]|jgi:predicted kinase
MERLPDRQPTLVLMAGLPGSGKSTLARALGKWLSWPVLDKDLCKAAFLDFQLGVPEDEIGRKVFEWLFVQARDLHVNQQLSIIFDAAAHAFIVKEMSQMAREANGSLKTILCRASSSLRRERLSRRSPTHAFMLPMHTAEIEDDLAHFTHLPADKLVIPTHQNHDDCLLQALRYLHAVNQLASQRDNCS